MGCPGTPAASTAAPSEHECSCCMFEVQAARFAHTGWVVVDGVFGSGRMSELAELTKTLAEADLSSGKSAVVPLSPLNGARSTSPARPGQTLIHIPPPHSGRKAVGRHWRRPDGRGTAARGGGWWLHHGAAAGAVGIRGHAPMVRRRGWRRGRLARDVRSGLRRSNRSD